jgi:hypothetical protein
MRWLLVAGSLLMLAGCGQQQETPTDSPAPPPQTQASSGVETATRQPDAGQAYAHVQVVGLDGQPIAGMEPIATKQPNAFNAPVARGPATDEEGRSYVVVPRDQWVYIRAWDRSCGLFANNFFDIPPGEGTQTDEMEIVMVPGTKLKATLVGANGAPAAKENVGLMLFHPTQGPWWPGEADTDENGVADFGMVPAGRFSIKIKAIRSGQIELPEAYFGPGETLDLGAVALQ